MTFSIRPQKEKECNLVYWNLCEKDTRVHDMGVETCNKSEEGGSGRLVPCGTGTYYRGCNEYYHMYVYMYMNIQCI